MTDRRPAAARLAIVVSHPIQYYAPWFTYLTRHSRRTIKVFYLWNPGSGPIRDPGFDCEIKWGIDLLAGYDSCFVPNVARDPGPHHFAGLNNPEVTAELVAWEPDAILLFGYKYSSHLRIMTSRRLRHVPMLFRGDSHLLAENGGAVRRLAKQAVLRIVFQRFAAFLSPGLAHTAYLKSNGVARSKIFPSPHAVDNRRFFAARMEAECEAEKWRLELRIPVDHRVILFAGKFERKKCPDDLVRAFQAANLPKATLWLVGSGPLESKLQRLAVGDPNIVFAPFQNQLAMPRTYAAADLVVLPSCGPGESWGLVINEALCCEKAVVATDHVGCHADLIQSGRNGMVVRAGDFTALSGALTTALSDSARLKQWGRKGREIISAFSYEATTAGLEQALTSVLAHRSRR